VDSGYGSAYAELYRTHWWWRARETIVLREIERALANSRQACSPGFDESSRPRILDVGCGDALFFDRLMNFGNVEGIESDGALVSPNNRHRECIHIGLLDDSFRPAAPYEVILMLDVLEHIKDPVPVLRRALELLAPCGLVLVTVPAFQGLWTTHDDLNHHFVRYTRRSFRQIAKSAAMNIERERYLFQWTFLPKLVAHFAEAVFKPKPSIPRTPPRPLNVLLAAMSVCEAGLFEKVPVPVGSSLLVVGRKTN
jgi:2-polyprenyl-3-methyl-5-hydroxy-6-metoxy-1,4-benzoquinol methylase